MTQKIVCTDKAPGAIGPYSQAVVSGPMLFVSGQLGLDPKTGELAGPDLDAQARQALKNLHQIVIAGGFELSHIVSVDVFMTQLTFFQTFNQIYSEFFSGHRPARAVIEVSALPKGAAIEIKCIAIK
jgi:2-iminobutanoate/2-iminopropanoate deaminase